MTRPRVSADYQPEPLVLTPKKLPTRGKRGRPRRPESATERRRRFEVYVYWSKNVEKYNALLAELNRARRTIPVRLRARMEKLLNLAFQMGQFHRAKDFAHHVVLRRAVEHPKKKPRISDPPPNN